MRVFVTGGSGFIGAHLVAQLLQEGMEVKVLHLKDDPLTNLKGLSFEGIQGDVRDLKALKIAMQGCSMVFHLAAIYKLWMKDPGLMEEVNIRGTENVMKAASETGIQKIVHTSSVAVFAGQGPDIDADENSEFKLAESGDVYSRTKYESEQIAREWADKGLPVTIVNPCPPIGPGDIAPTPTGKLLLSSLNLPIIPVMDTITNVIDVRDCARGHILAAEKGKSGRSYILGGKNYRHRDLVEIVRTISNIRKPLLRLPFPLLKATGYAMKFAAGISKSYEPLITPEAAEVSRMGVRANPQRAFNELGLPARLAEESVRDAIIWFARNNYLNNSSLAKRLSKLNINSR